MRVLRSHFRAGRGDDSLCAWTENEARCDVLAGNGEERPLQGSKLHTAEGKHTHTHKTGQTTNRGICIFFSDLCLKKNQNIQPHHK